MTDNIIRRRLSIASALLVGTALTPAAAFAQDGTWNGPGILYESGANWVPASVPTNRATFGANGPTTVVLTSNASINQILFAAGAQQYVFTIASGFTVNGIGNAGITNQSGVLQTVINNQTLTFNNVATVTGGTGTILIQNLSNGGSSPVITFNGNSGLDGDTDLLSSGGSASAVGTTQSGASALVTFNNNSSADGATLTFLGGNGGGQGGAGVAGDGTGGGSVATFNNASHADGGIIANLAGAGIGQGGGDPLSDGTGHGGSTLLIFNNTSHAANAEISNVAGPGLAQGGPVGDGEATGGTAVTTFNDAAHADGSILNNIGGSISSNSGAGANGSPGGTGVAGGTASGNGGNAGVNFNDSSHLDNGTIANTAGSTSIIGGLGGDGGSTGAGGSGGAASGTGGAATIVFGGTSHANGTDIANNAANSYAQGGAGGTGGSTGIGGTGGSATSLDGNGATILFTGNAAVSNGTISNNAADATAIGGQGGGGGNATGGTGGAAATTGTSATLLFSGSVTIGAGVVITNQAGDASAIGGAGGTGGPGAGGTGGTGGSANASGGEATIAFNDNSSAGSATITNTAGTASAQTGAGGAGNVGDGGTGGSAAASAGDATISFSNNATAGNATITNIAGAPINAALGAPGAPGGGGGAGGSPGVGSASAADASIIFNDNATGGSADISNQGGDVIFNNSSVFGSAAGATIVNINFGQTVFNDTSSLGAGTITNGGGSSGGTYFNHDSTAGTGSIVNQAGGVLSFADSATAGAATINNQTGAQAAFGNASDAGTAIITNSGGLFFNDDSDAVLARVIQTGGSLNIGGANATLRLGALSGNGSVTLGNNTFNIGYLDLNETFSGVISGNGQVIKRGTGTWVLTGANTYLGPTTVVQGTLQIDGSVTSNTTTEVAGTLRGIGTITGSLTNNGTVNAGNAANPTGTLNVTGSFTSNAGSFFLVNINGTNNNLVSAGGAVTLNGGTVRPQATPGTFFPMQFDYRIAVGASRTGAFAGVDESLLPTFVDTSLVYTATAAFLRVRRNATNFAAAAGLTPNQLAISTALDSAVASANPLVFTTYLDTYNTLLILAPTGPLQGALNVLSGDAQTVYPIVAQRAADRFGRRLNDNTWSNSSNLWGAVAYGDLDGDGDGNGPGYQADGLEVQIGFNTSLGANTRLGLSIGMSNGDVDIPDRVAAGGVDSWSVGAQLRHDTGNFYLSGQATYSWHSVDSRRELLVGGAATADFDAQTLTASAEIGLTIPAGQLSFEPFVGARYANTDQDAYSETGPAGALNVAATSYESTRLGLGVRLANRNPGAAVRPFVLVLYERDFGDDGAVLDNQLPGLPVYRVVSTDLGEDVITGELGLELQVGGGFSVFVAGGGHWRTNETNLHANAGARITF